MAEKGWKITIKTDSNSCPYQNNLDACTHPEHQMLSFAKASGRRLGKAQKTMVDIEQSAKCNKRLCPCN